MKLKLFSGYYIAQNRRTGELVHGNYVVTTTEKYKAVMQCLHFCCQRYPVDQFENHEAFFMEVDDSILESFR